MRPQEHYSGGTGPGSQGGGGHTQDLELSLGQAETGGTQGSEDTPAAVWPRAVQISAPHTWSIQAPADWELQELLWEQTPELESWLPPL